MAVRANAGAGFDAAHIVALFNGNVPMQQLGPAVSALFPDYVPHTGDEALGPLLEHCWRCALGCCQPPAHRRMSRWVRGVLPAAPIRRRGDRSTIARRITLHPSTLQLCAAPEPGQRGDQRSRQDSPRPAGTTKQGLRGQRGSLPRQRSTTR